jgi:hypothetical protein
MKCDASRDLFAYWNRQRGARLAPSRTDIDPGALGGALSHIFMLNRETGTEATFRLAGTRICELFGRELKSASFLSIWDARSRDDVAVLLEGMATENTGFLAGAIVDADYHAPVALELLMLPLYSTGSVEARTIGSLTPLAAGRFDLQTVSGLTLTGWRQVGPQIDAALVPRYADLPSSRPELVVFAGGQS